MTRSKPWKKSSIRLNEAGAKAQGVHVVNRRRHEARGDIFSNLGSIGVLILQKHLVVIGRRLDAHDDAVRRVHLVHVYGQFCFLHVHAIGFQARDALFYASGYFFARMREEILFPETCPLRFRRC